MSKLQPDLFPDQLQLCRVEADRNMSRFYRLTVQRDLFGGAMLSREFGRIGSPGRVIREMHRDGAKAVDALANWVLVKSKRGYKVQ